MTTEQLNQARAAAWRQTGNPLLTFDDAAAWLDETAICLFLPRVQIATPTPSFVEAVLGASDATPSPEAIETATELLHRLLATGDAVGLNLLGTPGEQPDFLATTETLPFLFALLGDKEWKRGPRGKSSPLVIEVWKLLDREGPLTTIEVKDKLGRQLTEAAALRALTDLWSHLRIEPVFKNGQPAAWQLLERSRLEQMQAGSSMSQAVALSALISLYLQSAVAASLEEVEIFLSPLASRSKVREVIKGLTATRQISTLNLGPVEMYHVEGSLPEFPEIGRLEGAVLETRGEASAGANAEAEMGEGRRRFVAKRLAGEAGAGIGSPSERTPRPTKRAGRPPSREASRTEVRGPASASRGHQAKESSDRRPFSPRPGTTGGERRPYGTRSPSGAGSFNPREPWKEDRKPAAPGEGAEHRPFAKTRDEGQAPGERRPFKPRESSGRKPFTPRTGDRPSAPRAGARPLGERKPFASRESGERKSFTPGEAGPGERKPFTPRPKDRPFRPRSDSQPLGERKSLADRKPFSPRKGDDRKPFAPGAGAERTNFGDRKPSDPRVDGSGERTPFKPRSNSKPFGERKPFGDRKPFVARSGGDRQPRTPREGGERRPFTPREGERKPFASRSGERPFKPRVGGRPVGEGQGFGGRKPFVPREGGERRPPGQREGGPGERRPARPGSGARPFKPRSDSRAGRPPSRGDGDRPVQRSSFGAARPGGPGARTSFGARKTTGAGRARTSPMTSSGKPRSGVKPPTGRPGPRATRGGAAGARSGIKRTGRPGKGRSK